ncbi:MAG: DinB family protein [Gemmatimonadaceae bacterium]
MTLDEQSVAIAINAWKGVIARLDEVVSGSTDEGLSAEVAPGRNRVSYVIGHLAVVHDRMLALLRLGDRLHSELDAEFLENPDSHAAGGASLATIRAVWSEVNAKLTSSMEALTTEQWFERHASVSEEDFQKQPLLNRYSVLLSRTNHASFHQGQIRLTK